MRTKNIIKTIAITSLLVISASCSDWLNVDMEDGIMENKLFETNEGFQASLNGIYTKMNEVYGSTLSMGVIDVMAQYYDVAQNNNHSLYAYAQYSFNQSNFEGTSGELWTNLYNLIANINTLLEHCDADDSNLKKHYYPYIKGEALALRAMLHFDLLRIYGPIYSEATSSSPTIPYQETSAKSIQPLLPSKDVIDRIIRDLNEASDILKEDVIRTDGCLNYDSDDLNVNSDFRYRQYRFNYYAIRGLLARVYAWTQNRAKAYEIAHEIITENKAFEWTPKANVQQSNPDRLFSTEVMFGLYNLSRVKLYDTYFNSVAPISRCLTFKGESTDEGVDDAKITYFYSDMDDLRRGMWKVETLEESADFGGGTSKSQKATCFNKYAEVSTDNTLRYMIPLMRMSEIYLIAAESTDDLTEAMGYINEIRKNRNCINLELKDSDTKATLQEYITKEFAREVIGEGQLYFYYKRHAMTVIQSGTDFGMWYSGTYNMDLKNYVWPLPKVEIDKRVTSN